MVLKELTKDQNTLFPSQTHIFPIWTSLALSGFFKAWAESMQAFLRPNFLPNARHILLILLILGPELKPEVALFLHSISIKIVSVVDVKIFKTQEMCAILALKVIYLVVVTLQTSAQPVIYELPFLMGISFLQFTPQHLVGS